MLKSSCIRATLSCNVRCVRRTTQVPHRARRPTSDTQVPQTKSRQVYGSRTEEFPPPVVQALLCAGLIIRVCHLKNGADSRGVKAKTYVIIGKVPNPRHSSQEDGIVAESGKLRAAVWLVP
ncbi:hypothetical protein WJX82_009603 [Trebouxia sp. C0006]